MAKSFHDRIWVAIDVGTTKICVMVARGSCVDDIEIIGIGKSASDGLRRGVVVDIARTVKSIRSAVAEAQLMAGIPIESAVIGISGAHIQSRNSNGAVPIKKDEVKKTDITNVINAAKALSLPEGQQILHVLPQFFTVDGQDRVHDPLGMFGVRLEVQVHIISGSVASVQNLVKCCEMAGVKVSDIILEQLASADAVLSADERELGVGVLDIGGGTSDFAVYQHDSIRHTKVVPIAGNLFTNDLAIGLGATIKDAERVKREFGLVHEQAYHQDAAIEVELVHGNQRGLVSQLDVLHILQPRAEELLNLIGQEIQQHGLRSFMRSGLVITGGSSLLKGLPELGMHMLGMPLRVGTLRAGYMVPDVLDHPMYATGYGLLLHELNKSRVQKRGVFEGPAVKRVYMRMKSWVSDFF